MRIRKLYKKEASELASVFTEIFNESFDHHPSRAVKDTLPSWTAERIAKRIKNNNYIVFVAEEGSSIVGFLAAKAKDRISYIHWLGILKDYQGKGTGGKLVTHWKEWAKSKGADKLRVLTSNKRNLGFYRKHGFRFIKKFTNKWGINKYRLSMNLTT